ncbi:AAA family ATPase [Gluconobacter frateurii]|uniref:CobQ/CobB/MinD/ParA nucleotide binding domain-containing protein n=1 Tax=Gluconobacter frateurii NRIC 0228 TaxID=1307946 RepID=A0ABQ0QFN7_9PROT|nr:AAA family ATPase [Gluconobacter frateurii]GBR17453.1 hypothetical protein AA0228_3031 [Gluconobacter frateurii NRIC 0228]GLP89609.1 chromosome partitioning protein ParA [Gluconobacter frateurii]
MGKVIVVSQSKGGSGKSTVCLVVAQILASRGFKVALLDGDPNKTILNWAGPIDTVGDLTEKNIVGQVNEKRSEYDFVFVDTEGVGNLLSSRAILKADFVLIPLQASVPDAIQANRVVQLIKDDEEAFERSIPHAFIFTRTNPAIKSKLEKAIRDEIDEAGYPVFQNQLNERSAFKAVFYHNCLLSQLPNDVAGVDKAIQNAEQVADELMEKLK